MSFKILFSSRDRRSTETLKSFRDREHDLKTKDEESLSFYFLQLVLALVMDVRRLSFLLACITLHALPSDRRDFKPVKRIP